VVSNLNLHSVILVNPALCCVTGFVKTLRIGIPWASLLSSPVTVLLDTIEVVLARGQGGAAHAPQAQSLSTPSTLPDWLLSTLTRVVSNVTLTLSNVIVRVQHAGVECTLTLQRAHVASADPAAGWTEAFVELSGECVSTQQVYIVRLKLLALHFAGPQQLLPKQIELPNVSITCNALAQSVDTAAALKGLRSVPSRSRRGSRASEASSAVGSRERDDVFSSTLSSMHSRCRSEKRTRRRY